MVDELKQQAGCLVEGRDLHLVASVNSVPHPIMMTCGILIKICLGVNLLTVNYIQAIN